MFRFFSTSVARVSALLLLSFSIHAERPPLTLELADHATGYMEWMLEMRFTAEQRQRYQQILAEMWHGSNQGSSDAIMTMARVHENLAGATEGERARMLGGVRKEFVGLLESAQ